MAGRAHTEEGTAIAALREAIAASESRFRTIFEGSIDGLLLVGAADSTILRANPAAEQLLGMDEGELVGRPFESLFPPEDAGAGDVLAHGPVIASQSFRLGDGTTSVMDVTAAVVPWEEGMAIFVTLRDVSERRRVEEAREELIRELDAFAHTVAHDLKTPLAVITGSAELLRGAQERLSAEDRARMLDAVVRSASKMGDIVDALLLLAGARDRPVRLRPFDPGPVVREVLERFATEIATRRAEVSTASRWPEVFGHAPWVEEVWANYLANALRHGGDPPRIELGADDAGEDSVRFWVRDHGAGIPVEARASLFTAFVRGSERTARGHGLGLSIVQRIVERLGGEVGLDSEIGAGSTFWFTLPRAEAEPTRTAP